MKTMVHVLDLLGCVATGPTTEEAVARTPAMIRAFLELLHRHGEKADPTAAIETAIADHVTEGDWLGNGSPYQLYNHTVGPPVAEATVPQRRQAAPEVPYQTVVAGSARGVRSQFPQIAIPQLRLPRAHHLRLALNEDSIRERRDLQGITTPENEISRPAALQ